MDLTVKNRTHPVIRAIRFAMVCGLAATFVLAALPAPVFAGKTERAAKCLKKGDTKVSKGIAKKTVKHAIKRFKLEDMNFDDSAIKGAKKEVYDFLKWKLGSPAAICAQYIGAGQKHFNKAYSDEAAAALLGVELPGEGKAEMTLPKEFVEKLKAEIDQAGTDAAEKIENDYGIPKEVSNIIIKEITKQAKKQVERIGFNMPKKWDVDNRLVQGLIAAKRHA